MESSIKPANAEIELQQPSWYAMHVRVNQERRVATHCQSRDITYFLPLFQSRRRWKDRSKCLECPLFPGYLFVQISLQHSMSVLTIPNVLSLVGNRTAAIPIPTHEIDQLREGLVARRIQRAADFVVGQRVRIISGPFEGMVGVLLNQRNKHVALSIEGIAQQFLVDLSMDEIIPFGETTSAEMHS